MNLTPSGLWLGLCFRLYSSIHIYWALDNNAWSRDRVKMWHHFDKLYLHFSAIPIWYSYWGLFIWDIQASIRCCSVLCCAFAGKFQPFGVIFVTIMKALQIWSLMEPLYLWRIGCYCSLSSPLRVFRFIIYFLQNQKVSLARRFALVPLGPPLLAYRSNCKAMLTAVDGAVQLVVDRPYKAGESIVVWYDFLSLNIMLLATNTNCPFPL